MTQKFVAYNCFSRRPHATQCRLTLFCYQNFIAAKKFLNLHRVIGERLSGCINSSQATADYYNRQANLHVGDGIRLGGTRQLQRHKKVRRSANTACHAVWYIEQCRTASASSQCNMIEAQLKSTFGSNGSTETHPSKQRELCAPLQQQANDFEKIFIPSNRNTVFGHPAKTGHNPVIQRLPQCACIVDRAKRHSIATCIHAR